ncbi:VOC family protein [Streptomyces palmae]|uniref:VOC family protein n=1 Tax=Streptomyces palmae TaxID=1701085 RepID=A0A4Z0HCU2_9ACTN|nr:VOC family protein [Streptomyces palmae]TGB14887.1 VOC family protein [Streptomyces palmae]
MSAYISPVPLPDLDAVAPEPYSGFYGMPVYSSLPTRDLAASKDFWVRGLGFIDLFSIPGQVVHLRRWAFQDVLLVPGEQAAQTPAMSICFSCVPSQIEEIAARCEEFVPGCTSGPREMPWNSLELTVVTPENARVVMTAARPIDPDSAQAESLRAVGIEIPRS